MSACLRCGVKIGFLGGFITSKGKICERCREIETLASRIDSILKLEKPVPMCRAFIESPKSLVPARRLAELDSENRELLISLACYDIETGTAPKSGADADENRLAALTVLFEEKQDSKYLESLLEIGRAKLVGEIIFRQAFEIREEWISLLERVATSGDPDDPASCRDIADIALGGALGLSGVKTRSLCRLVVSLLNDKNVDAVNKWLATARFVSVDELAAFVRSCRSALSDQQAAAVLETARTKVSGADEIMLLAALDCDEALDRALNKITEASPNILSVVERMAKTGKARFAVSFVERLAAPGPNARRLCDLATVLAAGNDDLVLDIMLKCEQWGRAAEYFSNRSSRDGDSRIVPAEITKKIRDHCLASMSKNEKALLPRLKKAINAVMENQIREAHILLASTAESAADRAPVAALSACAIDALLAAAELEAATQLSRDLDLLATRRKVRKGLSDEGAVSRSVPLLRESFISRCRKLLEMDGSPFCVILSSCAIDLTNVKYKTLCAADDNREARLLAASVAVDATSMSEQSLLHPTIARTFYDWLSTVCEHPEGASGAFQPFERSMLYGVLARRLLAPLDPKSDNPERTGPRDVAVECAARAIAFMPRVAATSENKWGDFIWSFSGALTHLGYQSSGIARQDEFWPSWLDEADKVSLTDKKLLASDHLPPLDGTTEFSIDSLYKAPSSDTDHAREKKKW